MVTFMGRHVENPAKRIVSFRVNEQEWHMLRQNADELGLNVSTIIRQIVESSDLFSSVDDLEK
jgi:predicted DNA binding CopG/RHH family protein